MIGEAALRCACASLAIAVLALAVLAPGLASDGAFAQGAEFQRSYIEPFPRGDRYRIARVRRFSRRRTCGQGLYRAFEEDEQHGGGQQARSPSSGFARPDRYDWNARARRYPEGRRRYQIAVVMFGDNDNQTIEERQGHRQAGHRRLGRALRQAGRSLRQEAPRQGPCRLLGRSCRSCAVPTTATMPRISTTIFREKSFINGAKFIDTWSGFTDESGRYSACWSGHGGPGPQAPRR